MHSVADRRADMDIVAAIFSAIASGLAIWSWFAARGAKNAATRIEQNVTQITQQVQQIEQYFNAPSVTQSGSQSPMIVNIQGDNVNLSVQTTSPQQPPPIEHEEDPTPETPATD